MARWRTGGQLEYLGRADHQLKVRGVSIEPSKIEALLAAQPGVAQALADGEGAMPRLLAYAVPDESHGAPDGDALRNALVRALPEPSCPPPWSCCRPGRSTPMARSITALPPPLDSPPTAHEAPQGELETALPCCGS